MDVPERCIPATNTCISVCLLPKGSVTAAPDSADHRPPPAASALGQVDSSSRVNENLTLLRIDGQAEETMPTIEENLDRWHTYDWSDKGDEWSEVWGGTHNLWNGSLLPRIEEHLPVGTILEIAPGFGRFTRYLKDRCEHLIAVDLTERCINACKERFSGETHITYQVNDGKSLPGVEDDSIDFVFSFDSLVHVEHEVIEGYLREMGRVLKPDGVGFFHHSNIGAFIDPSTGELTIENRHWRGTSVSAKRFRETGARFGISCVKQEIVNWGCDDMTDCLSTFARVGSRAGTETTIIENSGFMDEAIRLGRNPNPAG
jgi:SAM-dependent methyltransferase